MRKPKLYYFNFLYFHDKEKIKELSSIYGLNFTRIERDRNYNYLSYLDENIMLCDLEYFEMSKHSKGMIKHIRESIIKTDNLRQKQ